jgi:hypothetical protein
VSVWLGISELGDVCDAARARNLELFTTLGGWVTSTTDGERQRLYAEACHRHAWHAELWAARAPAIPGTSTADPAPEPAAVDEEERHIWYAETLTNLLDQLAALAERVDPELDPSTARTLRLLERDLTELTDRTRRTT